MKVATIVLAWILAGQVAAGDGGSNNGLPFPTARQPDSARNAPEAPRWNPGAVQARAVQQARMTQQAPPAQQAVLGAPTAAPPPAVQQAIQAAQDPSTQAAWPTPPRVVSAVESQPSTVDAAADSAPGLLPDDIEEDSRPIRSIMKSRTSSAAAPGVVPAQFNAPVPESAPNNAAISAPPASAPLAPAPVFAAPAVGSRYESPPAVAAPSVSPALPTAAGAPVSEAPAALAGPSVSPASPDATESAASPPARLSAPVPEAPAPAIRQEDLPPPTTETTSESSAKAAARAATDLLASSLPAEQPSGLSDRSVLLLETLSAAPGDSGRLAAIRAYWSLSRAFSEYQWAQDELKRLEQVVPSRGSVDSPMLSTARAAAAAHLHDAELSVRGAQESLAAAAGWQPGQSATSAYPADRPLVGPYLTYYDQLFAERPAPMRVRQINRCLPIRLNVINDRAAAVQSATSAVHFAEEAHARGEATLGTVLDCHEALYRQRREFLDAIQEYNQDIAEYAVIVAGPTAAAERLITMLIRSKQPDRIPLSERVSPPAASNDSKPPSSIMTASRDGWTASPPRAADRAPTPATGTGRTDSRDASGL